MVDQAILLGVGLVFSADGVDGGCVTGGEDGDDGLLIGTKRALQGEANGVDVGNVGRIRLAVGVLLRGDARRITARSVRGRGISGVGALGWEGDLMLRWGVGWCVGVVRCGVRS